MHSDSSIYRPDLAYIHDQGHDALARAAAECLVIKLSAGGHRHGVVVDLGCGSGVLAEQLVAAGFEVVGVDIAEPMIALARERMPRAHFENVPLLSFALPPCVAVTAVGEVLNYLADPRNDAEQRSALFRRIHGALQPGGVFLCDIATPARADAPRRTWATGPDWSVLAEAVLEPASGILTRTIISYRRVGELFRRADEVHRLALLDPVHLASQLQQAGFQVETLPSYGSEQTPHGIAVLCGLSSRS